MANSKGHNEWECLFIALDTEPCQIGPHTTMRCAVCGITFEKWMAWNIRQLFKRLDLIAVE